MSELPPKVNGHRVTPERSPTPMCCFPGCDRRQKPDAHAPLCLEHVVDFAASRYYRRFDILMRQGEPDRAKQALHDWVRETLLLLPKALR